MGWPLLKLVNCDVTVLVVLDVAEAKPPVASAKVSAACPAGII